MKYFTFAVLAGSAVADWNSIKCAPGDNCYEAVKHAAEEAVANQPEQQEPSLLRMFGVSAPPVALEVGKPIPITKTTAAQAFNLDFSDNAGSGELTPMFRFGLKFNWPVVNNYGCWCYGGDMWPGARDTTGFGPTMDDYDDACKAHHMGMDCIVADAKAEGKTCDPLNTTYNLFVIPQFDGSYKITCADDFDEDWCESRVCQVDIRFLARHHKLEGELVPDYEGFGHKDHHGNTAPGSGFDTQAHCVFPRNPSGPGGGLPSVQVCCGDYPYRIWYDINNTRNIRCCEYKDQAVIEDYGFSLEVGELYNGLTKECCASGVQPVGSSGC